MLQEGRGRWLRWSMHRACTAVVRGYRRRLSAINGLAADDLHSLSVQRGMLGDRSIRALDVVLSIRARQSARCPGGRASSSATSVQGQRLRPLHVAAVIATWLAVPQWLHAGMPWWPLILAIWLAMLVLVLRPEGTSMLMHRGRQWLGNVCGSAFRRG